MKIIIFHIYSGSLRERQWNLYYPMQQWCPNLSKSIYLLLINNESMSILFYPIWSYPITTWRWRKDDRKRWRWSEGEEHAFEAGFPWRQEGYPCRGLCWHEKKALQTGRQNYYYTAFPGLNSMALPVNVSAHLYLLSICLVCLLHPFLLSLCPQLTSFLNLLLQHLPSSCVFWHFFFLSNFLHHSTSMLL